MAGPGDRGLDGPGPARPSFRGSLSLFTPDQVQHYKASGDTGKPCTLSSAASARGVRCKTAVRGEPTRDPWVERSELCEAARRCVWSWASGWISGCQCMLRLEQCASVAQLLERDLGGPQDDMLDNEASLWVMGCIRLGGADDRLAGLKADLESKSPTQMLCEAWGAVERELGMKSDDMEMHEVNSGLRRLSTARKRRAPVDPAEYLRVQVWRELIRLAEGAEEAEEQWGAGASAPGFSGNDESMDDASIVEWLHRSEQEIREAAKGLTSEELSIGSDRMLTFAAHMLKMGTRLKEALEGWQRFDSYRIIGVKRGASLGEVRRAFYKKALVLHPDKGGDKEAFQELQRAYDEIMSECRGQENPAGPEDDGDDGTPISTPRRRRRSGQKASPKGRSPKQRKSPEAARQPPPRSPGAAGAAGQAGQESPQKAQGGDDVLSQMGLFVRKVSAAAAGTGQCAVEALRHSWAAMEALDDDPADTARGFASAELSLDAAIAVVEAGKLVEEHANMVAKILRDITEKRAASQGAEGGCESSPSAELEECAETIVTAGVMLSSATTACHGAVQETAAALQEAREAGGDDPITRLQSALSATIDASQTLALTALEVAVAAGKCREPAGAAGEQLDAEAEAGSPGAAGDADEGTECGEEQAAGSDDEDDAQADDRRSQDGGFGFQFPKGDAAWEAFEARQSLSMLLEGIRMLRITNRELLRVQNNARELAAKDAKALPAVPAEHRARAFALLAEFLDEAAVKFHGLLQLGLEGTGGDLTALDGSWVLEAAERSFSFLLRCSPELAVSFDPRAQALRAAAAMDVAVVRDMLEAQLGQRLKGSVMSLLLDAQIQWGDADSAVGLDALQEAATAALERAHAMIVDAFAPLAEGFHT